MKEIFEKTFSKLSLISFIIIFLLFLYTIFSNIFNSFSPQISNDGITIMRTIVFPALYSLMLFFILLILNIIGLAICIKHPELKSKWFSIVGIILSVILIGYIIIGILSGPI